MKKLMRIFSVFICVVSPALLFAQRNLSEEVNVVRPYKPILAEASKINSNPEIRIEPVKAASLDYTISASKPDSSTKPALLSAEKMRNETISKIYNAYLKVAGGNYSTSFGELYLTNTRSKDSQIGLHLKHHASSGPVAHTGFSEQQADIFGKRIFTPLTLSAGFSYDRDAINFYGFDQDTSISNYKQVYNFFELRTGLKRNTTTDSDELFYDINIKAYTTSDAFINTENNLGLHGFFSKKLNDASVHLRTSIESSRFNPDQMPENATPLSAVALVPFEQKNTLLEFSPSYIMDVNDFTFEGGFKIANDFAGSGFHLYPVLNADYKIVNDQLIAFAGITGRMKRNTYRDFYKENPFLVRDLLIRNTNESIEAYAGIKGSLGRKTSYRLKLFYTSLKDEAFFLNDSNIHRKFEIIYDDATVTGLDAELSYQQSDKVRLYAGVKVNSWSTDTSAEAWHKPLIDAHISATYNISDKFLISMDIFGLSSQKAIDYNLMVPEIVSLKPIVDLNFGIDYRYSKIISVFLKLNNLTGSKYERYYSYPVYGFNGLLGATFSF